MKTVAVTGGKGGVGKSTFSVLLANKLRSEGKKVVLADLDVECPNDYLLLGQELGEVMEDIFAKFPKLNKEKCTKCGLCVQKCPDNAIFQPRTTSGSGQATLEYPIFMHELCASCGLCWNLCPVRAIDVEEKVTGEIFVNQLGSLSVGQSDSKKKGTGVANFSSSRKEERRLKSVTAEKEQDSFWLVTGRSVGIIEETGPIVAKVKEYAKDLAEDAKADYLLLDTAPGLHCAVIRALWGVDKAYAVTEPTPLGAHDLKLILELLEKLEVPTKVVLNQADLGNRELVDPIVDHFKMEIAYEIPYSEELVNAYSRGEMQKIDCL